MTKATEFPSIYRVEHIRERKTVIRVAEALASLGSTAEIHALSESARTAEDAANALGIAVGQIASSLIFKLSDGSVVLIITSGRHRVDTALVSQDLGIGELLRVDAQFVKDFSGFSIGGVSPLGWINQPQITLIDEALNEYEVVWAAAGHPHAVYPTTFTELQSATGARAIKVSNE